MNNRSTSVVALCAMVALLAGAQAEPFAVDFQIVKVDGTCEVKLLGADKFTEATVGQKCPYGTAVKTSVGSSCVVKFSEGNGCLVHENTTAIIASDPKRTESKIITLNSDGSVAVNLSEGFRASNRLAVRTPSAVCEAMACEFTVQYKVIGTLQTTTVVCDEGSVTLAGDFFEMTSIDAGEHITCAGSPARDFVRIKSVKGDVTVAATDAKGGKRKVELATGDTVTILAEADKADPSKVAVIYTVEFADASKGKGPTWATPPQAKPEGAPKLAARPVAAPGPVESVWPSLTIGPPVIATATPVGLQ